MAVDGKWNMVIQTPMGERTGTVTLKQEGDSLTGEMSSADGTTAVENGRVNGDTLSWHASVTTPMPMTLEFEGKLDGDSFSGNVKLGAFGTSTFSCAAA